MAIDMSLFKNFTAGDSLADLRQSAGDVEMRTVDVDDITEHPENRSIDPEKVTELKRSFLDEGMAQPPTVRVHPRAEGLYEHISGWHRILAYRELWAETGDEKWHHIPVTLLKDCDDRKARRLLWQTNLIDSRLTPEERGHGYEVLAEEVESWRAEDPERFRGIRTNEIIAQSLSEKGQKVSASTVARARAAAKRTAAEGDAPKTEAFPLESEGSKSAGAVSRAVSRLEDAVSAGEDVPIESLRLSARRLRSVIAELEGGDSDGRA